MEQAGLQPRVSLANILVATDFSPASQTALLYALSIVRRYGANLFLAHIVRPDPLRAADSAAMRAPVDEAWREGHRLTTDLLVSGELRGIPHKLLIGQGEIWEGLAPMIRDHAIDLIVVGTRGRSGLRKMLLGSVAELIFRQASCPVLTVGPNIPGRAIQEMGLRRILYAADFTPQSLHAAAYALSLAQHYGAHLILLHVVQDVPVDVSLKKGRRKDVEARLRALVPPEAGLHPEPEFVVGFGMPAVRILEVAAEKLPDLIVLGVRQPGSGAFAGHRPWTTASEVTGKAACPVLTVRAPSAG